MPANSKKSKQVAKSSEFEFTDDGCVAVEEEAPPMNKPRKRSAIKNNSEDDTDSEGHVMESKGDMCENEMQSVLSTFGADISRTFAAKRKRLHSFTQASLKSSNRRYDDVFKSQQNERKKLADEFAKQSCAVINQWESDLSKTKDNEEKLENFLHQQHKSLQQQRVVQSQRIKALKQLHDQFTRSFTDLEKVHQSQQSNIQGELRKELALLQKRMLMDTQQEEISNVRKSLQTMLAQV